MHAPPVDRSVGCSLIISHIHPYLWEYFQDTPLHRSTAYKLLSTLFHFLLRPNSEVRDLCYHQVPPHLGFPHYRYTLQSYSFSPKSLPLHISVQILGQPTRSL